MTKPQTVTDATFEQAVLKTGELVLVDFWAPWCGPCRAVAPVVEQLSRDHAGRLKVVKVNADSAPAVSRRLQVSGIPTLLIFADGRERDRVVGAQPPDVLRRWVDRHLP